MNQLLEVIVSTAEDAVEAEAGGAGRLEVISRFDVGGFTPSLDLVREIRRCVAIPFRVMLRGNAGFTISSEPEMASRIAAARKAVDLGADGVVLGFLKENREIDLDSTGKIIDACPDLNGTFHHAFEDARDKLEAIEMLKQIPKVDRILSHAGAGGWSGKTDVIDAYSRHARPEIEVIAGGGVDAAAISQLTRRTTIREFHVGTAARTNGRVDRLKVRTLVETLNK